MFRLNVVFVAIVLLGCLAALAQRAEVPLQPNQTRPTIVVPPTEQTPPSKRLREGTAFKNKLVFFRPAGDRTVLYTVEGNQRYICLENLALERILTATQENSDRQFWKIDGEFTEFRRENFVQIRRAVIAQDPETTVPDAPLAP